MAASQYLGLGFLTGTAKSFLNTADVGEQEKVTYRDGERGGYQTDENIECSISLTEMEDEDFQALHSS